jgi:ABC-2 type transport system ATP-binding protein
MAALIEASGLVRRYGEVEALAGLDLELEAGRSVAVLGPNGAGKTTLVRCMSTVTRPDEGQLAVLGVNVLTDPGRVRRLIGLAGQRAAVVDALTGRENLMMVARLAGIGRRESAAATELVLDQLALLPVADRLVRTYSGGMRRRLDLAASLVTRPRLILLDEPTVGLDPRSRRDLWAAIRELRAEGTDVILTTQYLEEADELADRVVIIDRGTVVADGAPAELKARVGATTMHLSVRPEHVWDARVAVESHVPTTNVDPERGVITASVVGDPAVIAGVLASTAQRGIEIRELNLRQPSLDDVFLTLTGSGAQGSDGDAAVAVNGGGDEHN